MLKSTHKPIQLPPLPSPWTEHKAPSGHKYYYNPETKQSTYTRPTPAVEASPYPQAPPPIHYNPLGAQLDPAFVARFGTLPVQGRGGRQQYQHRQPHDRPATKHSIPGRTDWVLVKTKLGRRFVHNPDTNESLWKVPDELIPALVEFDIAERDKEERKARGEDPIDLTKVLGGSGLLETSSKHTGKDGSGKDNEDVEEESGSDEYEEVEVTDSEYESEGHPPKRRKTGEAEAVDAGDDEEMVYDENPEGTPSPADVPQEFGEEEMAAQLAAMGESYDLDPSEYYAPDEAYDGDEPAPYELSHDEAVASFQDMLDDHGISPFATWDNIIDSNNTSSEIISDDRYTLLPNMKSRKDVFGKWSVDRIAALKSQREKQVKQNPKIPFLSLLSNHATPKLFWAEFKRKFKREPELRETKLSDKEREKLYRDYIARTTKMTEETLKSDLRALMRDLTPSSSWNRGSSVEGVMPEALLADVKFVSVKPKDRERLVKEFVRTLPTAEEVASDGSLTEEEIKRRQEREKRDEALRKRGEQVQSAKWSQEKELAQSQRRLRQEELELERASRVGKNGLLQNLE